MAFLTLFYGFCGPIIQNSGEVFLADTCVMLYGILFLFNRHILLLFYRKQFIRIANIYIVTAFNQPFFQFVYNFNFLFFSKPIYSQQFIVFIFHTKF